MVARRAALGNDAFERVLESDLLECCSVVERRRHEHPENGLVDELRQGFAALVVRKPDQRDSVALEQIERHKDQCARTVLEQAESRAAALVECADLAVDHRRRAADCLPERFRGCREARRKVVVVAAPEHRLASHDTGNRPKPVPLRLERPFFADRQAGGGRREHRSVRGRWRFGVLAQQQPVPGIAVERGGNERPDPGEPLTVESNRQAPILLLLDKVVVASVPDLNGAGAVLAGRDLALEVGVGERVILDVNREMAFAWLEWNPLRDGPARKSAVALEAEVVVQTPRGMALDDEPQSTARSPLTIAERLRGLLGITLAAVRLGRHRAHDLAFARLSSYREGVKAFAKGTMSNAASRYGGHAPMAATCCYACRTCVQTNLIALGLAAVADAGAWIARIVRRPSAR